MTNEYLQRLAEEIAAAGGGQPVNFKNNTSTEVLSPDDYDLKSIFEIENALGKKFSDEQREIMKHKGSACIIATAGAGKTSTSVSLIAKRIKTGEINPEKMVYTTFSKDGAEEMRQRLEKLLYNLGIKKKVEVRTLHSFFLQLLKTFGYNMKIISESERLKYVKESCKDAGYILRDDDLKIINTLISYQMNNLMSNKQTIDSYVNTIEDLELETYNKIRSGFMQKKKAAGAMDYDDMQYYLYYWLVECDKSDDPRMKETARSVRDYCKAMYDSFFIDEAQDVSKLQYAIIREMVIDHNEPTKLDKTLVIIGDDDQCIYQWRGSDPSIILSIAPSFDMKTLPLSTNYRCLNNIVDFAAKGIGCNTTRYAKDMKAFDKGGKVSIAMSPKDDLCTLSTTAYYQIKYWLEHGEKAKDIAVLCRNNNHLMLLANMLLRDGVYCSMSNDMKLTESYVYKDMASIIELCEDSWNYSLTEQILWKMCRFLKISNARQIRMFQDNSSLSLRQAIGYILAEVVKVPVQFTDKVKVPVQAKEKVAYVAREFSHETIEDLTLLYTTLCTSDKPAKLRVLLTLYITSTKFLYKSRDKTRTVSGLANYLCRLCDKDGFEGMQRFLRMTQQFESQYYDVMDQKITFSTIHSAKGREWKNVIMFGIDNVSMPSLDGIEKMFNDGVETKDIFETIEEERKLCYVGNTRAKENLVIVTSSMPSMFILESLGEIDEACNQKICDLALNGELEKIYKPSIDKWIKDKTSPYYYDHSIYNPRLANKEKTETES